MTSALLLGLCCYTALPWLHMMIHANKQALRMCLARLKAPYTYLRCGHLRRLQRHKSFIFEHVHERRFAGIIKALKQSAESGTDSQRALSSEQALPTNQEKDFGVLVVQA